MKHLNELFEKNSAWAAGINKDNPDFFSELSEQQKPRYLWIGCSDSRVPATQVTGMRPGDLFVHRNIANVVVHTDANALSVLQYAVEALEVKHIIVCGHYGCGGVRAALENSTSGVIDNWLGHIRDVSRIYEDKLKDLDIEQQHDLLCELNVVEQVRNITSNQIIQKAWDNDAELTVHGLIYDLESGKLKDLNITVGSQDEVIDIQ